MPAALILLSALVASCSDHRARSSSEATFSRDDLTRVVLTQRDAPAGLRYSAAESGPGMLVRQGASPETMKQLQRFGFRSDYGTTFRGTNPRKGVTYVASAAALFPDASGASRALSLLRRKFLQVNPRAQAISARGLGDQSWALGGAFFHSAPPTFKAFYFSWRSGNLLESFAMTGYAPAVTAARARALAHELAGHAAHVVSSRR